MYVVEEVIVDEIVNVFNEDVVRSNLSDWYGISGEVLMKAYAAYGQSKFSDPEEYFNHFGILVETPNGVEQVRLNRSKGVWRSDKEIVSIDYERVEEEISNDIIQDIIETLEVYDRRTVEILSSRMH